MKDAMTKLKQQAGELAARAAADAEEAAHFRAHAESEYNDVAQELEQERQQASKLQKLYTQTQEALDNSDTKVKELSKQLQVAQDTADNLRRDMRNLQVGLILPCEHLSAIYSCTMSSYCWFPVSRGHSCGGHSFVSLQHKVS